jgi:hypothetical protein
MRTRASNRRSRGGHPLVHPMPWASAAARSAVNCKPLFGTRMRTARQHQFHPGRIGVVIVSAQLAQLRI